MSNQPPVYLNKPVENPLLVAALTAFEKNQGDEARKALFNELKTAVYLIAVQTDGLSMTKPDKNGKSTVTQNSQLKFFMSSDKAGNPYLPVFTDWQEIAKYTDKQVNTLVMPASDLWAFVLKQKGWHGVVLNPGDKKALPLDLSMIEALKK